MSGMSEAQKHDPATVPFGVHELPQELQPNSDLHARLTRPEVGATDEEAAALIESLPESIIRSESDELLAQRVADYRTGDVFDPADHNIKAVEDHVGDDPEKARDALAKERDGKNRSSLIEKLEKVAAADVVTTPPVVAASGAAEGSGDGSPHA